jgi:ketosteroid isomerase-like protein
VSDYAAAVEGVRKTIATYCQALDDYRTEDVVATFLPEGTASFPGAPLMEGQEAIRATYSRMRPGKPQRHVIANTLITELDGDRAVASSDLVFFLKGDDGWSVNLVGRYTDTLRKVGDEWFFASRELVFL